MKRKIVHITLTLLIFIGLFAGWASHRMKCNTRVWTQFKTTTNSLVGQDKSEACKAMSAMGMHLRMTARTRNDWKRAIDHVSPQPPYLPSAVALKYTDASGLTRKCALIYIDNKGKVSNVHIGLEYW